MKLSYVGTTILLAAVNLSSAQPAAPNTNQATTSIQSPNQQSITNIPSYTPESKKITLPDSTTELFAAIKKNDKNGVVNALQKGANPSSKDAEGNTAISLAITGKNERPFLSILSLLLGAGADANAVDKEGYAPLIKAIYNDHVLRLFKVLLAPGTHINCMVQDSDGNTPLMMLLKRINQEEKLHQLANWSNAANMLLDYCDASSLDTVNTEGLTPMLMAISGNAWSLNNFGEKLLAKHPNVNVADKNGETPLIKAIKSSNTSAIPVLLKESGIKIDAQDKDGKTALYWAQNPSGVSNDRRTCYNVITQLLLNAGATSPDLTEQLFKAIQEKEGKSTVERLINQGVSVNSKDANGNTPLIAAAQVGDEGLVRYLLSVQDQYHVQQAPIVFDPSKLKLGICYTNNIVPFAEIDAVDVTIKNNAGNDALAVASKNSIKELLQSYMDGI